MSMGGKQGKSARPEPYVVPGRMREVIPFGDMVVCGLPRVESAIQAPSAEAVLMAHGAEVLAVGPGRYSESGQLVPMRVEVGTRIMPRQGVKFTVVPYSDPPVFVIPEADVAYRVVDHEPSPLVVPSEPLVCVPRGVA